MLINRYAYEEWCGEDFALFDPSLPVDRMVLDAFTYMKSTGDWIVFFVCPDTWRLGFQNMDGTQEWFVTIDTELYGTAPFPKLLEGKGSPFLLPYLANHKTRLSLCIHVIKGRLKAIYEGKGL